MDRRTQEPCIADASTVAESAIVSSTTAPRAAAFTAQRALRNAVHFASVTPSMTRSSALGTGLARRNASSGGRTVGPADSAEGEIADTPPMWGDARQTGWADTAGLAARS